MKVKVGYVYNDFSFAVDLIKQGRFNWMIVESSVLYFYLVVGADDSHYFERLLDWMEDYEFAYLGYQCFYNERNTSFRYLVRDLTRVGGGLDIAIRLKYGVLKEPYKVQSKLDQGCAIVFLRHTGKTYHICVHSQKLKDVFSSLGYSQAYLLGVSASCFDAGGDTLEQIGGKIGQVVSPRKHLTYSRTEGGLIR